LKKLKVKKDKVHLSFQPKTKIIDSTRLRASIDIETNKISSMVNLQTEQLETENLANSGTQKFSNEVIKNSHENLRKLEMDEFQNSS